MFDSVIDHIIDISNYNSSAASSYIKLPKDLNHPKRVWLIFKILMIMNDLNGDIKFPVVLGTFTELKKRIRPLSVFLVMKIRKSNQSICQKNAVEKNMLIYYS